MPIVNGYCALTELRDQFGSAGPQLPEVDLIRAINATSRAIDRHCGRRFWQDPVPVARLFRPYDPDIAWVDDISTSDGLIVATDTGDGTWSTTWTAADYQLEPLNADLDEEAFAWWRLAAISGQMFPVHPLRATLRITARWGWSAIPDGVREACILRAAAIFKRREAIFGVAGLNGFGEVRITRRDPDVVALLADYIKIKVGAV